MQDRRTSQQVIRDIDNASHYDEKTHISRLLALAERGYSVLEICADFFISEEIFQEWLNKYDNFSKVWSVAKNLIVKNYIEMAHTNMYTKRFNKKLYDACCVLARINTTERLILFSNDVNSTLATISRNIINAVSDAKISANEAKSLLSSLASAAKIEEVEQLRTRVEELEKSLKSKSLE